MKKETFDRIVDNNPLYKDVLFKSFNENDLCNEKVRPTKWHGKDSEHSLSFTENGIKELFGIELDDKLKKRLDKRFHTVHSSALLALLFFYGISDNNSLTIKIDGKDYLFTDVFFEVKNKCVDDNHPSCIDVLLVSGDETSGKTLLFLESKFTEYLSCGKRGNINADYEEFYKQLNDFWNNKEAGVQWEKEDDNTLCIKGKGDGRTRHYCEGIKQMISHYIGLLQGPAEVESKDYFKGAKQLILGEIVYEFDDKQSKYDDYSKLYHSLAETLDDLKTEEIEHFKGLHRRENLKVLKDILTYQKLKDNNEDYYNNLPKNIKNFYHL